MKQEEIAVVGISALFPGSVDQYGFWNSIVQGKDFITDVPESHWLIEDYYDPDPDAPDKTYSKRGGFLPEVDFEPLAYSIPPINLKATDTSQLLALIVAQKVLEDACNSQFHQLERDKVSVVLGVSSATDLVVHLGSRIQRPFWAKALRDNGYSEAEVEKVCRDIAALYVPWQESSFPGMLGNVVAGRIANHFDLKGTNTVLDAACASSLSAVSMAMMELQSGRSDMVITGGVDTLNDIWVYMCFSKTQALSLSGDCRPFSDRADGTLLGEGLGMLALKRLSDAEKNGDRIYAVIKGVGTSSDGKFKSIYAPRAEGQALALRRAYAQAGYGPHTVELVEAHGTGTKAGDAAEFAALSDVFHSDRKRQWCALGSVKSQIGHTKAAAGAAGLFKAVMALHHQMLPPTIKVDAPNPALRIDHSPFYLNTESRPWIRGSDHPRRASVSAFGFGGSNFHVTLEEYTKAERRHAKWRVLPFELFVFAADTFEKLTEHMQSFADAAASRQPNTHDSHSAHVYAAKQSQKQFEPQKKHRAAVIAADHAEMIGKLKRAITLIRSSPNESIQDNDGIYYDSSVFTGKIALLFPGQGSQYVNMGKELAMHFDAAREVWDRSAELALDLEDESQLHRFVFPPPVFDEAARQRQHKLLTDTRIAQPAIGAMGLSMVRLLQKLGLQVDCMGGHSYGEITALAAAGVLSEQQMLNIAHARGRWMHGASMSRPGAMSAVMASAEVVQRIMDALQLDLVIANFNSPEQVVVSGTEAAIARLERQLKEASVRFVRLPVAAAFHSKLVEPAVEPFLRDLEQIPFGRAEVPVYGNLTGDPYPEGAAAIREQLAKQLARPVHFVEQIRRMAFSGVRLFIEVGPDSVLTGLVKRILGGTDIKAVALDRRSQPGSLSFWQALAQLSVWGIPLKLESLWEGFRVKEELPSENAKPSLTVKISGANYGRPYPGDRTTPIYNDRQVMQVETRNERQVTHQAAAETNVPAERPLSPAALIQSQMTEAHLAFQKALTESHHAYLRSTEKIMAAMTGHSLLNEAIGTRQAYDVNPYDVNQQDVAQLTRSSVSGPSAAGHEATVRYERQSRQAPIAPAVPTTPTSPTLSAQTVPIQAQASLLPDNRLSVMHKPKERDVEVEAGAGAGAELGTGAGTISGLSTDAVGDGKDIRSTMLEIVSDKTGYPQQMVDMDIDLESGLGIDSIKRGEILAAAQETIPGLSEFDPAEMASLRTLQEIVAFLEQMLKKNGMTD